MEAGTQSRYGKQGRGGSTVVRFSRRLPELCQQRLGLLQVFRIKSFGELAVNLGQPMTSLLLLGLSLPQPTHTHHRSQLQGLSTLAAGNDKGLEKTCFGLSLARPMMNDQG
jgi:hypothetical protein